MKFSNSKGNGGSASKAGAPGHDAIGSELRRYYESVEQEPIPDQLLDLLEKLDQVERSGDSNGTS